MAKGKKVSKTKKTGITGKPKKTKKVLKNRIAIVLDRSGSMGPIRAEAVAMFNEQIKAIKETTAGMDTKVSFATFSTVADKPLIFNESADKLVPLTESSYTPDGWTAMFDGVGSMIDALSKLPEASDEDCSFLVVVISDGAENYSREYNAVSIADKIKTLQGTKRWTFSYLGANQDLSVVSQTLGIPLGNTYRFTASVPGAYAASTVNSASTRSYMGARGQGMTSSANFYSTPPTQSGTVDPGGSPGASSGVSSGAGTPGASSGVSHTGGTSGSSGTTAKKKGVK